MKKITLVYIGTDQCQPCVRFLPVVKKIAERKDIPLNVMHTSHTFDLENNPFAKFLIYLLNSLPEGKGFPQLLAYDDKGELKGRMIGEVSEIQLIARLNVWTEFDLDAEKKVFKKDEAGNTLLPYSELKYRWRNVQDGIIYVPAEYLESVAGVPINLGTGKGIYVNRGEILVLTPDGYFGRIKEEESNK